MFDLSATARPEKDSIKTIQTGFNDSHTPHDGVRNDSIKTTALENLKSIEKSLIVRPALHLAELTF